MIPGDAHDGQRLEIATLRAENDRLIALLESHGIEWRAPQSVVVVTREPEPSRLSSAEKVALFRRLFRGRTDVYPVRWEGKTSGKSGYAPACANEWRAGICEKPRIKCGDCSNRLLTPLSDAVIYDHLAGEHTVGVYPLLEDDTCYFWQSILTRPTGVTTREPLCVPAKNWVFRRHWKFLGPEMAHTHGCSLPVAFPPAMPGAWGQRSSVIPARAPGN